MSEFKPGDKVRCVDDTKQHQATKFHVVKDRIYTVEWIRFDDRVCLVGHPSVFFYHYRFELVTEPAEVAVTDALPDTVMIQVDRKAELERIETAHDYMVDNMCSIIRRYADEYDLNFCDNRLESFCNEVGIDFTTADVKRRAVIYLDLEAAPLRDQKATLERLLPSVGDGVGWRQAYIDNDNEGEESEWSSHPLTEGTDGLRPIQ